MRSHYAYTAITAALHYRNLTGEGQYLDCSVHEACALTTESHVPHWIYAKQVVHRQTGRHANARGGTPRTQLPTGDSRFVNTGGGINAGRFKSVVEWMKSHDAAGEWDDPQYEDHNVLQEHQARFVDHLRNFIATVSADEAFNSAQQGGAPWGIVRAPNDLLDDDHFRLRGFFPEVEHPELTQRFTYPGAAAIYSASPWRIYRRAPLLGEDKATVYGDFSIDALGLANLKVAGVV